MKKSILYITAVALALSAGFYGCKKDKDPELDASPKSLNFTHAGESKTFNVTSDVNWTISGNHDWLTISDASGKGDKAVTVTAAANTGAARTATLTIAAKGATSVSVNITQAAAPSSDPTKINIAAITGVTPPVAGASPVTAITASDQYTGTVAWSPAVASTFANSTTYTATITLTAKTGFTLAGVAADFFTVAGATSANNAANNGVITAVFPATASPTPVITITQNPAVSTTVTAGSITASLTVAATATDGATPTYQWYSNNSASNEGGTLLGGMTGTTFAIPTVLTAGTYYYFCEVNATGAEPKRTTVATVTVNPVAGVEQFTVGGIYYKAVYEYDDDYNLIYTTNVKVTNKLYSDNYSDIFSTASNSYSGNITIPATVVFDEVTYPVTKVGFGAFSVSAGLTSVTLPVGIDEIERNAFYSCTSLGTVTLPAGLEIIGAEAFEGCSLLTSITLPDGLKEIHGTAFHNCALLASLHIPVSVNIIGEQVFRGCVILSLTAEAGGIYSVVDGVLFEKVSGNAQHTVRWLEEKKTGDYSFPDGVERIANYSINNSALTKITFPASIMEIGHYSFENCDSMTDITLNWANPSAVTMGLGVFDYAPKGNITLRVPAGTVALYSAHALWGSGFKAIVEQ